MPPGPGNAIYCAGMVGPPEGGSVDFSLPVSVGASTTNVSFSQPTLVSLLVVVVYDGTQSYTWSESFTVGASKG